MMREVYVTVRGLSTVDVSVDDDEPTITAADVAHAVKYGVTVDDPEVIDWRPADDD